VDFDGDGQADIISGSYHPGNLYLFKGSADGTFAKGEFINGADGNPVNVGPAAAVFAADFDGSGVLDLVIGNINGQVFLLRNTGTRGAPKFAQGKQLTVDGKPLKVQGDAGPTVADWNGDGKLDLIVGDDSGEVRMYPNRSSNWPPDFGPPEILVKATGQNYNAPAKGAPSSSGTRTKPAVADFNGDGRLDLLVGDVSYSAPEPEPKPDEPLAAPTTQPAEAQQRLRTVLKAYQAESARLRSLPVSASADERKQLESHVNGLLQQVQAAHEVATKAQREQLAQRARQRARTGQPQIHGYVWFYERKPKS